MKSVVAVGLEIAAALLVFLAGARRAEACGGVTATIADIMIRVGTRSTRSIYDPPLGGVSPQPEHREQRHGH